MTKKFTGSFKTLDNTYTYTVTIGPSDADQTINIEDPLDSNVYEHPDDTHVMFASDPVIITCDRQDLTKRIIISQATINLVTNANLTEDLFANNNREIPVYIDYGSGVAFYGYVDPMQFDQGYAFHWENVQVNATDPLGALEHLNVGDLNNINASTQITSWDLINAIFEAAKISNFTDNINATVKAAMQNTWFNLTQFFGKSEADWSDLYTLLDEICKYWNLYVTYYGNEARITCSINDTSSEIEITDFKNKAADSSTSISVDDAYTKIELTCNINPDNTLVPSFDDDDYLYSKYNNYTRYMTELISLGGGMEAFDGFRELVTSADRHSNHNDSYTIDNFVYVKQNDAWDFGPQGYTKLNYDDQKQYLTWLKQHPGKAAIIGFGRSNKLNQKDNSPIPNINITNYLVISICGNYMDNDAGYQASGAMAQAAQPICKYVGLNSNILTPIDAQTTNYIVISGKILYNPLQKLTGYKWNSDSEKLTNDLITVQKIYETGPWQSQVLLFQHTVPMDGSDNGAYYQQDWDSGTYDLHGFLGNKLNQEYEYEYSKIGDDIKAVDNVSKLSVLACQLKVGDKYCVERLDIGQEGVGKFEWMTQEQFDIIKEQNMNDDPYVVPYFTIGIDPKMNDYIIGQTFDVQSNTNYTMNLNAIGTAIPIIMNDHLGGTIEFAILGPYNTIWTDIKKTYHGWWFWRHEHWEGVDDPHPILQQIQSIMIQDFKIEVTSDNGMINRNKTTADNDLVYASDTNPAFTEIMGVDHKVCTTLTSEECDRWGIKQQVSNSYIYKTDNTPFYGFQGAQGFTKPEECTVDYLYREYCAKSGTSTKPAKQIHTSVKIDTLPHGPQGTHLNYEMTNNYITGIYTGDNETPYRLMSYSSDLKKKKIDIMLREYRTQGITQI